jgi:hypothetical protein
MRVPTVTGGCCAGVAVFPAGSTFRTNSLGLGVPSKKQCAAPVTAPCVVMEPTLAAFEAGVLPGVLTSSRVVDEEAGIVARDIRVVRAAHGAGAAAYAVGVGFSTATGEKEGLLVTALPPSATVLRFTTTDGFLYRLTKPQNAVVVCVDTVVVVGSGSIANAATGDLVAPEVPAVAVVKCGVVTQLVVSNVDGFFVEAYQDIAVNPFDATTFLVTSYAEMTEGVPTVALFRALDVDTLQPVPLGDGSYTYTALAPVTDGVSQYGLCIAAVQATCMVVIAYAALVGEGLYNTGVWALRATDYTTIYYTGFNDAATGYIVPQAGATTLVPLAVLPGADAAIYLAVSVTLASTLQHAVQVYKFGTDTNVDVAWGASGCVTWYDTAATTTRANDAVLSQDGRAVFVTGNAFQTSAGAPFQYVVDDGFYDLWQTVAADEGSAPTPFVLEVSGVTGAARHVFRFPCVCGCAPVRWASSLVVTGPFTGVLIGDVDWECASSITLAYVLAAALNMAACPLRVTNAQGVFDGAVKEGADGFVAVKAPCATTTTLLVAGGVTVGCVPDAAPVVPGTLRYNDGTLQYYDGVTWQTLAIVSPP